MLRLPRHAERWLPGYLCSRVNALAGRARHGMPSRVWVAIADHFEPYWRRPGDETALARVRRWRDRWPEIASRHADSAGHRPVYTFFYPQEEYHPRLLDLLGEMVRQGVADVEVHIHHDGGGRQEFVDRVGGFCETLHQDHGLLRKVDRRVRFGFIHGNLALDNSLGGRWCGLNDEITLLGQLGCYADFTMPSGSSPTQARLVNAVYWAVDDPARPRSYDRGRTVVRGRLGEGDLLMIPGPLGLRWRGRLLPRLETGELAGHDLPTAYRARRWLDLAPRVGSDIFLKLYAHGAQEANSEALLGGGLDLLFQSLSAECSQELELRYASAWEMYLAVLAAAKAQRNVGV